MRIPAVFFALVFTFLSSFAHSQAPSPKPLTLKSVNLAAPASTNTSVPAMPAIQDVSAVFAHPELNKQSNPAAKPSSVRMPTSFEFHRMTLASYRVATNK